MQDVNQVKEFLEQVAETGAHNGRDVEGFVIRCKMTHNPDQKPFQDWFFKYKFEEPYLLYRQWREATKALIGGKTPRYKKHKAITEEYLLYARKRLAADRTLGTLYNQNHGIIALRNDFLEFKNIKGSDAANFEALYGHGPVKTEVYGNVILVPVATIGCGKTTIAVALTELFGWGHVQNDNITGRQRPPRFTKAILDQLDDHPAVFADRNNAEKRERKQLITDVNLQHKTARLVALHFVHGNIEDVRRVTHERVFNRGDNHQTLQAATDMNKVRMVMEGFIDRFEPCSPESRPDDGFDSVIDLDPTASSRVNLETVITQLHHIYPNFVPAVPSAEDMDKAIQTALEGYKPNLRHTIPERGGKNKDKEIGYKSQPAAQQPKKKPLEYIGVDVSTTDVNAVLEKAFANVKGDESRFYKQLKGTRRVQPNFHVTLMHRATAQQHPELWARYSRLYTEAEAAAAAGGNGAGGAGGPKLGKLDVQLERVVFDDRIMAIVVRLVPGPEDIGPENPDKPEWECVNRVAHITVGTRDDHVKPKESNDLLQKWLEEGSGAENRIGQLVIEGKPIVNGTVKGVLSR
jgi:tRNA ligase